MYFIVYQILHFVQNDIGVLRNDIGNVLDDIGDRPDQ